MNIVGIFYGLPCSFVKAVYIIPMLVIAPAACDCPLDAVLAASTATLSAGLLGGVGEWQ
jgi:hypothetical protein